MAFEQALPPVPAATEARPPADRAPWGYADMAKAIAVVVGAVIGVSLPLIFIVSLLAGGDMDDEGDAVLALGMVLSFVLEGVLLVAAAMFSVRKYRLAWSSLGLRRPSRGGYWLPVPLFVAALGIIGAYTAAVSALGADVEGNVPDETFDSTLLIVFLGILSLALAPLMEEVFFRGFLFGGLRGRWGAVGAACASGLLFGLAHFAGVDSLSLLPAIGIIGILFAWGYYFSGSLFAPVAAHFGFNLVAFVFGVAT